MNAIHSRMADSPVPTLDWFVMFRPGRFEIAVCMAMISGKFVALT